MKKLNKITLLIVLTALVLNAAAFAADTVKKPWEIYGPGKPMTRMMSKYYRVESNHVITLGQNCHYPDDVIAALEIHKATGVSTQKILDMRKAGQSWLDVMSRAGYSPSRLFTPVSGKVPQVFRHAYGQYHRWRANPGYVMRLYDKEIRNLSGVKFMTGKFRVSPISVMRRRQGGITFTKMASERL